MTLKTQKLSRAEAVELVKKEQPFIDFGAEDSDLLSHSELVYLNALGMRLKYQGWQRDNNGSRGRAVYNYLARHKFPIWEIWGDYGSGPELLTIDMSLQETKVTVDAYRSSGTGGGVHRKRRMVTQRQFDKI